MTVPFRPSPPPAPTLLAAVDLGSNSFHAIVARVVQGELLVVDRLRDTVRLAAGLSPDLKLSDEVTSRALECLAKFGQALATVPPGGVRAVGTSTLRRASNASAFLEEARRTLGHPIEIISGREEARLLYLGVAHSISDDAGRRLVVDIGGGSTECILGERFEPLVTDSLEMGCVAYTTRFFPDGEIKASALRTARTAARRELQPIERRYRTLGWDTCVGASGTIGAIAAILNETGWSKGGITLAGLQKLEKALLTAGKSSKLDLPGLRADRALVLPAGVAILGAVFEGLEIEHMASASGALREGVLYDLLGRIRHEDVRDRTVQRMAERWHADLEQAARVERTASALLRQVAQPWQLEESHARQLLGWAARLHEIGLQVAYSGYHKHGAYLAAHADMPGFSRDEQLLLADLIRAQRRKLTGLVRDLPPDRAERTLRLALLLRLAVLLNRSRSSRALPPLGLTVDKARLVLTLPARWLEEHPLTDADLQAEGQELGDAGVKLVVETAQ
jgi:exopolyphosphatase/guanosine-5'-triphosphate,3'-diphosphate pyrophosphatase